MLLIIYISVVALLSTLAYYAWVERSKLDMLVKFVFLVFSLFNYGLLFNVVKFNLGV